MREARVRRTVDLAEHLNETIVRGNPADFPVTTKPVYYGKDDAYEPIPHRLAIVRADTGQTLSVVSDRYTLIPHQHVLDVVEQAVRPLDLGPVPRGIYVDRQGARMRALFKFPALAQPVLDGDDICPCLKIQNTYDGTSRIAIHIGAFRFVCTNLAVGGGGVFAGGFMSIHAGEIPLEKFTEQASKYLGGFDQIVETYRLWAGEWLGAGALDSILEGIPSWHRKQIRQVFATHKPTAYEVYNAATFYATHKTRSYRIAFDLLERINCGFQKHFPAALKSALESTRESQNIAPPHAEAHDPNPAHAVA
jgi:Domain of unknown function (DUF932)